MIMTQVTTEALVSEAILEQEREVTVGGQTFRVKPPTLATLIEASRHISRLPQEILTEDNIVQDTLRFARYAEPIADALCVLVDGAEKCPCETQKGGKIGFQWLKGVIMRFGHRRGLKRKIMYRLTPSQLQELLSSVLQRMELGDFFALSTFLCQVNQTKPTKVETTGAQARGRR